MPEPLVVALQALTPIWTGDANRKGSRIRETGVLGSLRWWYEAIIRGMNRYACDPTGNSCVYAKEQRAASVCLACQLFGCGDFHAVGEAVRTCFACAYFYLSDGTQVVFPTWRLAARVGSRPLN